LPTISENLFGGVVKAICSLLILTFSRNGYTLTISQNNNIWRDCVLTAASPHIIIHTNI